MREFLMELYIQHGERAFPYNYKNGEYSRLFIMARMRLFILEIAHARYEYDANNLSYQLTAKALEYIKKND